MVNEFFKDKEKHYAHCMKKLLAMNYPEKKINLFLQLYKEKYDRFGRCGLRYNVAIDLMDDLVKLRKDGTRWIGCVGPGGTGKSTFMKNVLYFLDSSFSPATRLENDSIKFINKFKDFPLVRSFKALLQDEPDDKV